jgi:hypothetical protein
MSTDTASSTDLPVEYGTVLLMRDMARLFRTSPSTIRRRMAEGTFPIAPLPGIDAKVRWWGPSVQRWLKAQAQPAAPVADLQDRQP